MRKIELMINREYVRISPTQILYAKVTDKLCKIYLNTQEILTLFLAINELERLIGAEYCIRISRSCLVLKAAIHQIDKGKVFLLDGTCLPFSKRRKRLIMEDYEMYLDQVDEEKDRTIMDFASGFSFWDSVPFGFAVLELVTDHNGQSVDFIFRYANEALAEIEGVALEDMLDQTYGTIFLSAQKKWVSIYSQVAFTGMHKEVVGYSREIDKMLRILCYQPSYGYCACIVTIAQ